MERRAREGKSPAPKLASSVPSSPSQVVPPLSPGPDPYPCCLKTPVYPWWPPGEASVESPTVPSTRPLPSEDPNSCSKYSALCSSTSLSAPQQRPGGPGRPSSAVVVIPAHPSSAAPLRISYSTGILALLFFSLPKYKKSAGVSPLPCKGSCTADQVHKATAKTSPCPHCSRELGGRQNGLLQRSPGVGILV